MSNELCQFHAVGLEGSHRVVTGSEGCSREVLAGSTYCKNLRKRLVRRTYLLSSPGPSPGSGPGAMPGDSAGCRKDCSRQVQV